MPPRALFQRVENKRDILFARRPVDKCRADGGFSGEEGGGEQDPSILFERLEEVVALRCIRAAQGKTDGMEAGKAFTWRAWILKLGYANSTGVFLSLRWLSRWKKKERMCRNRSNDHLRMSSNRFSLFPPQPQLLRNLSQQLIHFCHRLIRYL